MTKINAYIAYALQVWLKECSKLNYYVIDINLDRWFSEKMHEDNESD